MVLFPDSPAPLHIGGREKGEILRGGENNMVEMYDPQCCRTERVLTCKLQLQVHAQIVYTTRSFHGNDGNTL